MMKCLMAAMAVFVALFAVVGPVVAADSFGARLRGFEETPVPISTPGQGFLFASLNDAGTILTYSLVYFGLDNVTQAHIHFGQPGISGGIVLFFCTNLTPPAGVPAPPACPNGPGFNTVGGTLSAANVIAQTAQGIAAGDFTEVINAMKAGVSYANIHTTTVPTGEVRGVITP